MASSKKAPKIHTKLYVLHVVKTEDKILVRPEGRKAYMHYKRWCYQNLPSRANYWDQTAQLYAIDLEKVDTTLAGENILSSLKRDFTVHEWLPSE